MSNEQEPNNMLDGDGAFFWGADFGSANFDQEINDSDPDAALARQLGFNPEAVRVWALATSDAPSISRSGWNPIFPFGMFFNRHSEHVPNGVRYKFNRGEDFLRGVQFAIKYGLTIDGGETVNLALLATLATTLQEAITAADEMGYPVGKYAVTERHVRGGNSIHVNIVSLETGYYFSERMAHQKMYLLFEDWDLYSIRSAPLQNSLQAAASHGLPLLWSVYYVSGYGKDFVSPNLTVIRSEKKALRHAKVLQLDYIREMVRVLMLLLGQKMMTTFRSGWERWSRTEGAGEAVMAYSKFRQFMNADIDSSYRFLKSLIKYANHVGRAHCDSAQLAGFLFCINKRVRSGDAVSVDILDDVETSRVSIGIVESDEDEEDYGHDGLVYRPTNSELAEYESEEGNDYSAVKKGTPILVNTNALQDSEGVPIEMDESYEGKQVLMDYEGCYVDGNGKLFVALTGTSKMESREVVWERGSIDDDDVVNEYYLTAGDEEDPSTVIERNIFIFSNPGASLPFYDEDGVIEWVNLDEVTAHGQMAEAEGNMAVDNAEAEAEGNMDAEDNAEAEGNMAVDNAMAEGNRDVEGVAAHGQMADAANEWVVGQQAEV